MLPGHRSLFRKSGWARDPNSEGGHSRWLTWSFLLLAVPAAFVILFLIDAATSKTEHKQGFVEAKHFSPEFTVPSVQLATNSKGETVTVPTQQTYPESYEVEVDDGCRFAVPTDTFKRIRIGDGISYREGRELIYRNCEWDPR
jgi:hypothetical protein